jgi:hypothetical protein
VYNLSRSFNLVGPVTNAPGWNRDGRIGEKRQNVFHYFPEYVVQDDPVYLSTVSSYLRANYQIEEVVESAINGFFLMAKTDTWWTGAYDSKNVFSPFFPMDGNEDELQARWLQLGRHIGYVPSSFIFHYRAVSRGERFLCDGWFRRP